MLRFTVSAADQMCIRDRVGTQMIVKGHDFPAVTLMGILAADMSLSAADYRASERTLSLIHI